jgi:hypothetical protein
LGARGRSRLDLSRSPGTIRSSSASRLALVSLPPAITSISCARVVPAWVVSGSGRRVARSRVRSASPSCASCSSRPHARALRLVRRRQWLFARQPPGTRRTRSPLPAPRIAVRDTSFTTRRDNHTRMLSLRSSVGISPVTSADYTCPRTTGMTRTN